MTREEAIQITNDMGAHSYAYGWVVDALIEGAKIGAAEQKAIDIETIPQLYVRWLMIDDELFEKPSWEEYATKAMEE